ncbi:hypothetical protein [Roseibium aggregatum]|uniref:hypothetical protein n=1 Tax=Roseibium aggregatum TaxID=187304 RepID=UPI0025AC4D56|nr:hypothetical protein [Roseibium aggregatum]WJS00325.1 hypothetical protein QUB73_14125 [Roseibium aggregatum]
MTTQTPRAFSYEPETFRTIAQDLQTYRATGHPGRERRSTTPLIVDWSKTLLPFPGIIGTSGMATVLEPVFAFSDDNSWALLAQGWVRLENHVDDRLEIARRITP